DRIHSFIVDLSEAKVGCDCGGKIGSNSNPPVIRHPLQALEKIKLSHRQQTDEKDDCRRNRYWRLLERLEFHRQRTKQKNQSNSRSLWFVKRKSDCKLI